MHCRHEPGVGRDRDAPLGQCRTDLDVIENGGGNASIRLAGMATTGAAVVARTVGIVDHGGGMAADGDDPRKPIREPEVSQHAFSQTNPLVEREGIIRAIQVGAEPSLLVPREAVVSRIGHGPRDANRVGEKLRQIGEPQRLHEAVAGDR